MHWPHSLIDSIALEYSKIPLEVMKNWRFDNIQGLGVQPREKIEKPCLVFQLQEKNV